MLRLDRVGATVEVPLARPFDAGALADHPRLLALMQHQAAQYAGLVLRVRLLKRDRVLAIIDEQRRLWMEAGSEGEKTLEREQARRTQLRGHVREMVVAIPGLEVGGVDLGTVEDGELLAQVVDEAHLIALLVDVATRAVEAQSPSAATKNLSASSSPPAEEASSTSAA